jgi:hypothetical protein
MRQAGASGDLATSEPRRDERVCIETATHAITGNVSLPLEGYRARFSDYLNRNDVDYLSLTDVERVPLDGGTASRFSFLAVARSTVLFAYPVDAATTDPS